AAMPHDCLDPLPIACEIVTALQTYVARQVAVTDPAVLSITKLNAGSAHNVIPSTVEMLGTMRTLSERTREQVRAAFIR
ncbi:peptidase dimerization domain-containing protein, partial [Pseudomonas aeruginosa]